MNRTIADVIRERERRAPEPTMPRPGGIATVREQPAATRGPTLTMEARDGRRWGWDAELEVGGHQHESWRPMGRDEAEAVAMALRGLGWREVRHG